MPPEIVPTADPVPDPDPPQPQPQRTGEVVCGFCETRCAAANGDVIKLSKRAKQLRDFEDDLEDANRTIAERDATIAQLKRHNEELNSELTKRKQSGW